MVVPAVMFVFGVIGLIMKRQGEMVFVLLVVPVAMSAGATLFAMILFALRRGYWNGRNVLLTFVGAIPFVVFLGALFVNSLMHMHM